MRRRWDYTRFPHVWGRAIPALSRLSLIIGIILVWGWKTVGAQAVWVGGELSPRFEVAPGAVRQGSLQIHNPTALSQRVSLYLQDVVQDPTGRSAYTSPGGLDRSLAPWLELESEELTLAPGESRNVTYRIAVPESVAKPAGTYWTAIMIEPVRDAPVERDGGDAASDVARLSFGLRFRHSVVVQADFQDRGERSLAITDASVRADDVGTRSAVLGVNVINRGESAERGNVTLDVYDEHGVLAVRLQRPLPALLPGAGARLEWDLSDLDAGRYQAILLVDTGAGDVYGARYRFGLVGE